MPVPTDITDLSATAASNSPAGGDSIGTSLDDYLRAIQSIIKGNVSKGSDIASASTITIPNVGSYFVVTGTTTINGFSDIFNGKVCYLKFSGILTLTNSASLILFGSDITTAAGDSGIFVNESSGVWRCLAFTASTGGVSLVASDIGVTVQAYDANLPTWPSTVDATEVGYLNGVTSAIQTQLDAKQAASTALTTATTFGGDVSGTYNAIVVANDSHTHSDSTIDSLNASAITAGTMATARLGSGTASSSTFLRGDSTWQTVTSYTQPTTFGAVGTYALLGGRISGSSGGANYQFTQGESVSASYLYYSGFAAFESSFSFTITSSPAPSGTWRCMGYAAYEGNLRNACIFLRIS